MDLNHCYWNILNLRRHRNVYVKFGDWALLYMTPGPDREQYAIY